MKDEMKNSTKSKSKFLFLDIDGVCNSLETFKTNYRRNGSSLLGIDPYMAFLVGKIILDTDCKVVLSSSWRHTQSGIDEVSEQVYKIHDITRKDGNGFRGDEIKDWVDQHKDEIEGYAIIDDDHDFHDWQPLFKTSWHKGINDVIAKNLTTYLKHIDRSKCTVCGEQMRPDLNSTMFNKEYWDGHTFIPCPFHGKVSDNLRVMVG